MAIPIGTTARQMEWLARWMLAAVVIAGMVAWWWPGYHGWGAMASGLLVSLMLWLLWRTVSADRTVPGHPVHVVLAVPAAVLVFHLARTGLGTAPRGPGALAGAMNMSMISQLALTLAGVMLAQSLLGQAARHVVVLGLCGAAMMGGSAAAMIWGQAAPVRTALALVGFAGVGVWLSMLWGLAPAEPPGPGGPARPARRPPAVACVAVAAVATVALAAVAPLQALLVAGLVAMTLLLAGLVFPRRRVALLAGGGAMAVGVVGALSLARWVREAMVDLIVQAGRGSWFGLGEEAFRDVSAADNGVVVLAATVGWLATGCFIVGLLACLAWLMSHARRGQAGDQARAVLWTSASASVGCALLAPGGLFIPAVTLAAALVWGLLPAMLGRGPRRRPGVLLLAGVGALVLLLGLTKRGGLLQWSASAFGAGDSFFHVATGFFLALLLAWLLGSRRLWPGLVGIVLAALAGGSGELLQALASARTAEFRDWFFHAAGSAAAIVPYVLCIAARWCESPDARKAAPL